MAIYKDNNKKVYAIDGNCMHLRCALAWNKDEKSWDCPCHGSRFDIYGKLLNGPALENAPKITISD